MTKKRKVTSRVDRWQEQASEAERSVNEVLDLVEDVSEVSGDDRHAVIQLLLSECDKAIDALSELSSVKEEYDAWHDNMEANEGLQATATYERLEEIVALDIEDARDRLNEVRDRIDNELNNTTASLDDEGELINDIRDDLQGIQNDVESFLSVDLPRGFGRD